MLSTPVRVLATMATIRAVSGRDRGTRAITARPEQRHEDQGGEDREAGRGLRGEQRGRHQYFTCVSTNTTSSAAPRAIMSA